MAGGIVLLIIVLLAAIVVSKSIKIIGQAEVMVIERLGRFHRVARSGLNILIPFVERAAALDVRYFESRRRRHEEHHRRLDGAHRPARAGAQLPEPAGHHEGQRHDRHRRGRSTIASPIRRRRRTPCRTFRTRSRRSRARRCATSSARWSSTQTLGSRDMINKRMREVIEEASDRLGRRRHARRAAGDRAAARHPAVDGAA